MVFLITGSLLHVYRLLCLLHAFIPLVTWALAPVNLLKWKRMLGPRFRNQDCKMVVRPAVCSWSQELFFLLLSSSSNTKRASIYWAPLSTRRWCHLLEGGICMWPLQGRGGNTRMKVSLADPRPPHLFIPTADLMAFGSSTFQPIPCILCLFNFRHFSMCTSVSHCDFHFHLPQKLMTLNTSSCPCPSVCIFCEVSV